MGPFLLLIGIILIAAAIILFVTNFVDSRRMRKELLGFIEEIDSKLTRAEQKDALGERYLRIRDTLKRHRTTISE